MLGSKSRRRQAPLPSPSPRIIRLSRHHSRGRSTPKRSVAPPPAQLPMKNLGSLIREERLNSSSTTEQQIRRSRVSVAPSLPYTSSEESAGVDSGEERWKVEAEILRAECNFLRMEKEAAVQKLDKSRAQAEAAIRSAVNTLISGKRKVNRKDNENRVKAFSEVIEELEEMLADIKGFSNRRSAACSPEIDKSSRRNFDRQASVLRRRIERMTEERCIDREIKEITSVSSNSPAVVPKQRDEQEESSKKEAPAPMFPTLSGDAWLHEVEMVRRKMEGLSKGMIDNLLSATTVTSSGGGSEKMHGRSRHQQRQVQQNQVGVSKDHQNQEAKELVGQCGCKEVVERILDQVKADAEQWNEMQAMLDQLRQEMEELQASRDLWQRRAISSDISARSLQTQVLEWKQRALGSEQKAIDLKKRIVEQKSDIQTLKAEFSNPCSSSAMATQSDGSKKLESIRTRGQKQVSTTEYSQEKEKHVLFCRLKNTKSSLPRRRSPLQEIGNL